MKAFRQLGKVQDGERGQMLVMFAFFLVVLILFVGLGIDLGFAYVTKAELSKAVDAAALAGMDSISDTTTVASSVAAATFAANYGRPGRDTGSVTPHIAFTTDTSNNTILNVDATATINTFFIRVLPAWKTMSVKASAQTTKAKLIMALSLDRSGSMQVNGGCVALKPAVTNFISRFDNAHDRVGMSTFSSGATLDVPISQPFKSLIIAKVPTSCDGFTFSDGGLTLARDAVNNVPVIAGENVIRVLVFFTDGYANTYQATFACAQTQPLNFEADDFPVDGSKAGRFMKANGDTINNCTVTNLDTATPQCCPITTFASVDPAQPVKPVNWSNVWNEAQRRALFTADSARANGTVIYSIGLGSALNRDFLKAIANDPTGAGYLGYRYDPNQPAGEAVFAPDDKALDAVFQTVASKILLRLTQ